MPKAQVAALLLDWGIWAYMAYCIFFLIRYLHQTFIALSRYDVLEFPGYAWPVTIVGTLFIAIVWESLGPSIGQKAQGLRLIRMDRSPASIKDRLLRVPFSFVTWSLSLIGALLSLVPFVGLGTLFWNIYTGSGISFIPAVPLWAIGGWWITLLLTLASIAILTAISVPVLLAARFLLRKLWARQSEGLPWAQRCCGTDIIHVSELDQGSVRPKRWFETSSGIMVFILIGITLCVGWLLVEINLEDLFSRANLMQRLVGQLLNPDFSTFTAIDPLLQDSIATAIVETIFMALFATLLGFVIAFPISFLGARNLMGKGPIGWLIYTVTRAFFNVFRSVEVLIWALIFAVWVSFGPFAGVIALAIHTIAALGKLYSEQVESIDPGPVEAMTAAGARRWQIIIYGIIPQVIPSFMAFTMYRWDINVRMSTVIGLVGGGGIGRLLFHYKNELEWEKVGAVVIVIVAVVWTMDYVSGRVRERIS